MSKTVLFKNWGVGVGLRSAHYPLFLNSDTRPQSVDWVEVVSENFMHGRLIQNTQSHQTLINICESVPVALHGVSLSIGSSQALDPAYLASLKNLVKEVNPIVVSDHLCWTKAHGVQTHDLNPLPYTPDLVRHVANKIKQVQDTLGRRILIENVSSYVSFEASTMSEEEFIREVTEAADCGILLDINNVYVSAINHGFDPQKFLAALPHHRVGQIHLAGHSEEKGFLIDTHDHAIRDEVWNLYRWYGEHYGHASSMVERDANIPAWTELEKEVLKMKSLFLPEPLHVLEHMANTSLSVLAGKSRFAEAELENHEKKWIHSLMHDFQVEGIQNQPPLKSEERFAVYENAFWLRLEEALEMDFVTFQKKIEETGGEEAWGDVLYQALRQRPPSSWSLTELSENFVQALTELKHPHLALAEEDWAREKAKLLSSRPLDEKVNREFEALSAVPEQEFEKVKLVFHPSLQFFSAKKGIFWNDGVAKEKTVDEKEWQGLMFIREGAPLPQLMEFQEYLPEWVRSGIIRGWEKTESEKK